MSDYISREETLERLCKDVCNVSDCQCDEIRCEEWFVIHDVPAADVRPVVTCGECKHRFNYPICAYRSDDWFCGYGEKREES